MYSNYAPAKISIDELKEIQALEESTGKVILAVEPQTKYARLTRDELDLLQKTERDLDVVMVAYEP